jgi:serine/threonine-protein kinase
MPVITAPDLVMLLAMTFGMAARAAYVPSTARRTLVLSLILGVGYLVAVHVAYRDLPHELLALPEVRALDLTPEQFARGQLVSSAVWWSIAIMLVTGISYVIYGLRREVREGRRLGQYALTERLGEGGMGVVYRARHTMLRRETAIKLLKPGGANQHALTRFEREVQLTAKLSHPNTVTVFDYGRTPEGTFYYAMELLDGPTLDDIVAATGPQPPARVVKVWGDVLGALREAHAIGLIHRDLKPANILLVERGGALDVAKVVDFGLVKDLSTDQPGLTNDGALTGTPQYISPEAIQRPDDVGPRSDLYSLGAVAYFLLTGTHVFSGATLVEVCSHHLHTPPTPPSVRLGRPLPRALEALVMACLSKRPEDRPASALAVAQRLSAIDDLPRWTEDDARAWWSEHRAKLDSFRAASAPTASPSLTVLGVDLQQR